MPPLALRKGARSRPVLALLLRPLGVQRVMVSDPYHLLRTRQHFLLHGFEVTTNPTFLTARHMRALDHFSWAVRKRPPRCCSTCKGTYHNGPIVGRVVQRDWSPPGASRWPSALRAAVVDGYGIQN